MRLKAIPRVITMVQRGERWRRDDNVGTTAMQTAIAGAVPATPTNVDEDE